MKSNKNSGMKIIINEQQKQMLIVLKSSTEAKIEELGHDSLFDYSLAKVSKPSYIQSKVDIFAEILKTKNELNEYKLSRNSREKLITNLENETMAKNERVKIIQYKYDESESRRVNLALELEELRKH